MRCILILLAGMIMLSGARAFAQDFDYVLKDRAPTIRITSPSEGQSVSPVNLTIRWKAIRRAGKSLGFVVENVETGKRIFYGDAYGATGKQVTRTITGLRPGRYRIIGYHYAMKGAWTLAGVGPEFEIIEHVEPFWTKWGQPKKLCRHFAATSRYRVEETKKITCTESRCVDPKFYWLAGDNWAVLEDRPSWLGDDKIIIKVRCLPPTAEINLDKLDENSNE